MARKSFIITTILMPILMVGLMLLPALLMLMSGPENKNIAVVDYSQVIAPTLTNDGKIQFIDMPLTTNVDSLKRSEAFDAVLVIGSDIVQSPSNVSMYTHSAPSITTEEYIANQIKKTIEQKRIDEQNIENLEAIIAKINANVRIETFRIDQDEEKESSSMMSYFIGLIMAMLLYMFIMIYGQMVMTSIIEEKNNRVLEIVVSSVRPFTLMMGKILGVGLVAVTQIFIWGLIIGACSQWLMPILMKSAAGDGASIAAALGQLANVGYVMGLFAYIVLFLIGGYLLYASIYAAIGSSVDNIQDASQLTSIAIVPIIIGIMCSMSVLNDPNSSMAFWMSMIPLTSPMVMMARIPFGIPTWEIWLSLALLVAGSILLVWFAAKIYRVGIFMYGKKPSMKDLVRWARYK